MNRLTENNCNNVTHWNGVYLMDEYTKGVDDLKFSVIAQHIIDGSVVVDFGCGNGDLLAAINKVKPKCRLIGIDFSAEGMTQAREKIPALESHVCDVTYTPLQKNSADFVISLETLEHLDNPQELIDEMIRVLKPGGLFILTTPYKDHIPSGEHVWEFDYEDLTMMSVGKLSPRWVFPWASGRLKMTVNHEIIYPNGNLDEIFLIGRKP